MNPFTYSRAYVVGIANYHYAPWQLQAPVNDARAIAALLQEQEGYEVTTLLDPDAAKLRALFQQIKTEVTDSDTRVLFYYAGHGIQRDKGLKGYFLPVDASPVSPVSPVPQVGANPGVPQVGTGPDGDANLIPMEDLSELLDALPARHLLLVLDCCFAGSFRMPEQRALSSVLRQDRKYRQHYDIYTSQPARKVMTSASYEQKGFDGPKDADARSPFASYLLQALAGDADLSGDRLITAGELSLYLNDQIPQSADNLPSIGFDALDGDGEGEYLFFLDGFDLEKLSEQAYENPYKGLESYEIKDSGLFFGRQKAIRTLFDKVAEQPFVIVVGASGTGKSSLVKAGVVPRLGSLTQRPIPVIRPGRTPVAMLPPAELWDILVIDQWEELVTQTRQESDQAAFYAEIGRLLDAGKRIIGTVRADFEVQTRPQNLAARWALGRYVVPAFTAEEYHDIILQPANRVACLFENDDLVERIEQEVIQQPGALPLLSFMLSDLFERAKKETTRYREIKWKHYEDVGGLSGALLNKAEEVYTGLPDDAHRDTLRRLMLRLVTPMAGGDMAGRRVMLSELEFDVEAENTQLARVMEDLDGAKLIRRATDNTGKRYIEPAHDALVRSWPRLWKWVRNMGYTHLDLHEKLSTAIGDYLAYGQKSFLWALDPRLDQVLVLMRKEPLLLNKNANAFVKNSINERNRKIRHSMFRKVFIALISLGALILYIIDKCN